MCRLDGCKPGPASVDGAGRCEMPAESEAAAGVAGRTAEAVCGNPKACCEPALAVAAEDAGRGGSWERRVRPETISGHPLGDHCPCIAG